VLEAWKQEGLEQEEAMRRDMFFVARDFKEAQRRLLYEETSHFRVFEAQKLVVFFVKLTDQDFELRHREDFQELTAEELSEKVNFEFGSVLDMHLNRLYYTGEESQYAILTMDDSEFNVTLYEALYVGNMFENGDRWRFYKVFNDELPSAQEL